MRGWLWGAAIFAAACSTHSPHADEPLQGPTADELAGEWMSQYITAGAVYRYSRLWFEEGGVFRTQTVHNYSFTEPPTRSEATGDFEVTSRGTVLCRWNGAETEDSLTIVSGRTIDEPHPCCASVGGPRVWTHLGYRAQDRERTRFHSERSQRARRADEDTDRTESTRVDLAFSRSPVQLRPGDDCALDLSIAVEVSGPEGAESRRVDLALPCTVTEKTSGILVLLIAGHETAGGFSVLEFPPASATAWADLLASRAPTGDWPEALQKLIVRSFRPYLVVDRERSDLMFSYFNPMALVPEGYVSVPPEP